MRTYSRELKAQLVKKLLTAGGPSVAALSREAGVGESTLFAWRKQFREHGKPAGAAAAVNADKLNAVIATAAMNAVERAAYCREQGLHVQQLDTWRHAFETVDLQAGATDRRALVHERQRVRALTKELRRKGAAKHCPHALSAAEQQQIAATCNQPTYQDLPPSQIVPRLADAEQYLASEASFYRVLRARRQDRHRGWAQPPRKVAKPKAWEATGPARVWTWDITYLPTTTGLITQTR